VTDSVASAGLTKNNPIMVSQDVLIELDSSGLFFPSFPGFEFAYSSSVPSGSPQQTENVTSFRELLRDNM